MSKTNWKSAQDFRPDGYTARLLHDCTPCRVVLFNLNAGQAVEPHKANACVVMHVVDGAGFIRKGEEEYSVSKDDLMFFEPLEIHGMRAAENESINILATIIPAPAGAGTCSH
ncbi:MAG: AraC family ligand binding domain-containing protein [Acidobacteriia bacterium]|nr:AraC family ligand binding domain-containing protein [Terriglobia bacterium]